MNVIHGYRNDKALRDSFNNFFVKGAVFDEFEERQLRIPSLSHT